MTFIARIRHHSLVWKNWHQNAKVSGVLGGVVFRWEPNHIYRSGILTADQIEAFRLHPDVTLEMVTTPLPELGDVPITAPAVTVPPVSAAVTRPAKIAAREDWNLRAANIKAGTSTPPKK